MLNALRPQCRQLRLLRTGQQPMTQGNRIWNLLDTWGESEGSETGVPLPKGLVATPFRRWKFDYHPPNQALAGLCGRQEFQMRLP